MGINPQNPQPPFAEPGKQRPDNDIEQPVPPSEGEDPGDEDEVYDDEYDDDDAVP